MSRIKRFFEKIREARFSRVCSCGHVVSANLPFCPHCGHTLDDGSYLNMD
jgi:hypothetical protein